MFKEAEQLKNPGEFHKYVEDIEANDDVRTDGHQLAYVGENIKIVKMIPKNKIVVDVGCGFGFQHVLYQEHKKWIGIQIFRVGHNKRSNDPIELKVFTKNAKIIQKEFKNVTEKELGWTEKNKDKFFGVASHSLWHDTSRNKEDIEYFKRLFPYNYYVTDDTGSVIEYSIMPKRKKEETEEQVVSDCDHVWVSNIGKEERYFCEKNCGATSE